MTTIRQVADEAGVSIGTVSRVLNHKTGVGQETRRHVLDIAQQLGYNIPKRTPTVSRDVTHLGLLYHPMHGGLANPFYQNVFLGIEQACSENQISLSINSLDMDLVDGDQLNALPPLLDNDNLSGILLVGAISEKVLARLTGHFMKPIVLVDNTYPNSVWDSVMIDNEQGMSQILTHLMEQGHRQIALVSGPDRPSIVERRETYQQMMAQCNFKATIVFPSDLEPAEAEQSVEKILRQAPHTTAIACSNDMQAATVIRKLQSQGCKVPDDISVTGFDDTNMAQFTSPSITTVHVDRLALGQVATDKLLSRIKNRTKPIMKTVMGVKLITRESVATPRRT